MSNITFPGFNLSFNVNRVTINIGGIDIYWYAILIALAFGIAILFCNKDDGKYNIKFENILEILVIVIPSSIICARIYYIIFNLNYYMSNPIQMLNFRNGGLAIYGGIIGAVIATIIYCKKKKINIFDMLDYIVPYLPLRSSNRQMG